MSVIDFKKMQKKLANRSTSDAQSKQTLKSDKHGKIRTDLLPEKSDELNTLIPMQQTEDITQLILYVIANAWEKPFGLNSKYARDNSLPLSIAVQLGHVTTEFAPNKFGRKYLATQDGIDFLQNFGNFDDDFDGFK